MAAKCELCGKGPQSAFALSKPSSPAIPSLEDLMAEAFNDLFIKYNVPTVRQTEF